MGRRTVVAVFSVCVHAIVLLLALTADLWRPITEWPTPRSAMAYEPPPRPVHIEDVQIPKTVARRAPAGSRRTATTFQPQRVPLAAPEAISRETGGEQPFSALPPGAPGDLKVGHVSDIGIPPVPLPPAAPQPQTPIRLHSGIMAPQRVVNVTPVYPLIAKSAHVEGVVIIEATLDERGNVVRTQVLRSIPLLDAAAIDAVRRWKFTPTLLNGIAVPIVMTVTVNFTLQ